jgi:hypothetical protein
VKSAACSRALPFLLFAVARFCGAPEQTAFSTFHFSPLTFHPPPFASLREIFSVSVVSCGSRYFDWMGEFIGRILPVADSRCPVASAR